MDSMSKTRHSKTDLLSNDEDNEIEKVVYL